MREKECLHSAEWCAVIHSQKQSEGKVFQSGLCLLFKNNLFEPQESGLCFVLSVLFKQQKQWKELLNFLQY